MDFKKRKNNSSMLNGNGCGEREEITSINGKGREK